MTKPLIILRSLIQELLSPSATSVNQVISNIDEIIQALEDISSSKDCSISDRMILKSCIKIIGSSTSSDGRKMSTAISNVIDVLDRIKNQDAKEMILRLQTIVRRDLPVSGIYDTPQSGLNSPFNPAKSTKFGPTP